MKSWFVAVWSPVVKLSGKVRAWLGTPTTDGASALDERVHAAFAWFLRILPKRLGRRVRKATGERFGIGSQVLVGLGGGVVLTLVASVLALGLMTVLNSRQGQINERYIPALVAAFEVARSSSELVRATPRLVAADAREELEAVTEDVEREEAVLRAQVQEIQRADPSGAGSSVVPLAETVVENLTQITQLATQRISYRERVNQLADSIQIVGLEMQLLLAEALDDQEFFIDTGLRELTDNPAPLSARTAQEELVHHRGLLNFQASQNVATASMLQTISQNADLLRANRERVETALSDAERAIADMREDVADQLTPLLASLSRLYSANGVYTTRRLELDELAETEDLVAQNEQTTAQLVTMVEDLVLRTQESTTDAAQGSERLLSVGVWLVLGVNVLAVAAAVVVGWKFFGQRLLHRVRDLSSAMRRMSSGDLEVQVQMAGNDEVTDMASDLEVFRKHALEVQRLNLVEKLAGEVQAKNSELESTLADLRRTQEQVVKQEKLASLGALTAGVAHEIRNPLNFVNNFAELSNDLVEELREELETALAGADNDAKNGAGAKKNGSSANGLDLEYLEEILGDLTLNVNKVKEHGERANRIVEGMLAHSRDEAGDVEALDINQLVAEYANLAYHGLRAADPTFNLTIERDFDADAGQVEGIARDISRVFLNIIQNSCQATDARNKASQDKSYNPELLLITEGREDSVCVKVRDNGTGIPDEIVKKIFDPFFTTKTGTKGTGLGLSISHEIVQEHGGKLMVDSKEGEFTEFTVILPRKAVLKPAEKEAEAAT